MMTDYGKFLGDPMFRPVLQELRRRAVIYAPFRNECCRNLAPDVFEPLSSAGHGYHPHHCKPVVQRLGGTPHTMDFLARRRHDALPDATFLLLCRPQGFAGTATERTRSIISSVSITTPKRNDHSSAGVSASWSNPRKSFLEPIFLPDGPRHGGRPARSGLFTPTELQEIERGNRLAHAALQSVSASEGRRHGCMPPSDKKIIESWKGSGVGSRSCG